MLSVKRGQVVRVIQVTLGEWWYVENRDGLRGYVPHLYLKEYPTGVAQITNNAVNVPQTRSNDNEANLSAQSESEPPTAEANEIEKEDKEKTSMEDEKR